MHAPPTTNYTVGSLNACVINLVNCCDLANQLVHCRVPRYAPYFWVKNVTKTTIELSVTDPNDVADVTTYTVYYWGHRFGQESSTQRIHRDFGQRIFSTSE